MKTEITVATLTASVTILGWIVSNYFIRKRDDRTRRLEITLKRMERQIEGFYGPLFSLNEQMRNAWDIREAILSPRGDRGNCPLSESDRKRVEEYLQEQYFFPIHGQIRELLRTKLFLIDGAEVPASFNAYLRHATQEKAQSEIWRNLNIGTDYLKGTGYSQQFFDDVKNRLRQVMQEYDATVSEMRIGQQRSPGRGRIPEESRAAIASGCSED